MSEQAMMIEVESPNPTDITERASDGSRRMVSTLAAVLVMALAGAGFWMLSNDDAAVVEIAAGEADDAEEGADAEDDDAQADSSEADGSENGAAGGDGDGTTANVSLKFTDVSSDNTPQSGRVKADNGIYYVLSSSPGQVRLDYENMTDEELMDAWRQDTFYVLNEDRVWQITEMEDRFVSDFDARDGLLYVVSTGSQSGAGSAVGVSSDQGKTFEWTALPDDAAAIQMSVLATADGAVILGSRFGNPGWEEVIELANNAGHPVDDFTLREFDHSGFSYIPLDPSDPCAGVRHRYGEEVVGFGSYIDGLADGDERTGAEAEYAQMLEWIQEEITGSGCEMDPDWATPGLTKLGDLPEPLRITWESINFTPPDRWTPWTGVFTFDGQTLTDRGVPFGDDLTFGYTESVDEKLSIIAFDAGANFEGGETRFVTPDGINWESERVDYSRHEEGYYYEEYPGYHEPRAGQHLYRLGWDEEASRVHEEEWMAYEAGERDEEPVWIEPTPFMERSVDGQNWEKISLAELAPNVDVGNRVIQDVRGTDLGLFLIFREQWRGEDEGPPASGQTIVYSSNGTDWDSLQLDGMGIDVHSNNGELLVLSFDWMLQSDGSPSVTKSYLVRPAG